MNLSNLIRGVVKKYPNLKLLLKRGNSKLSPFQYVYQTLTMTGFSIVAFAVIIFLFTKHNLSYMFMGFGLLMFSAFFIYKFWFSIIGVQITKLGRDLDADLLFVSEYFLVTLESGLPLGNAIENISKLNRPGGIFFKRLYTEFKTGKSLDAALGEASNFAPSQNLKSLIKKLQDSLNIGVDLKVVLENFIESSSEQKLLDTKAYAKKLNPIIMIYLLLGIVLPSLGVTFFTLGAAMLSITPEFLKILLIFIFIIMFAFQYFAYSTFRFSKSTI